MIHFTESFRSFSKRIVFTFRMAVKTLCIRGNVITKTNRVRVMVPHEIPSPRLTYKWYLGSFLFPFWIKNRLKINLHRNIKRFYWNKCCKSLFAIDKSVFFSPSLTNRFAAVKWFYLPPLALFAWTYWHWQFITSGMVNRMLDETLKSSEFCKWNKIFI